MLTHKSIWAAIDGVAKKRGLSTSALAKACGLDPTAFNRSKRFSPTGKPRWPSTESLAKVLSTAELNMTDFADLVMRKPAESRPEAQSLLPVISLREAINGQHFDELGQPAGEGWDELRFPDEVDENTFAVENSGCSL